MADQNDDLFDRYVNRPALEEETDFAVQQMTRILEVIKQLNAIKVNIGGSNSFTEISTGATESKVKVDALSAATEKLLVSQGSMAKQLAEVRVVQQQVNKSNTDAAKEALGVTGAYDRLVKSYNEAAKAAKNLAAEQGQQSNAAQKAAAQAFELGNKVKAIDASVGQFQKNVGNYSSAFEGIGEKFHHVGEKIGETIADFATAYIGLIGIQGVGNFLEKTIEEFQAAEVKIASFRGILSNLGREDLFDKLIEKAEKLEKVYKVFDKDEFIQVFDKLVTYGKLTERQIDDLTPVIADFAAKQRIGIGEATDVIIKGLEGSGKALKEYGINVKDATNESGGMATASDRLKLLMEQLKPRVEGAAFAFGNTAAGGIKAAKVEVEELEKSIGAKLQPVLTGFLQVFLQGISGIGEALQQQIQNVKDLATGFFQFATNLYNSGGNLGLAIGITSAQKATREAAEKFKEDAANIRESAKSIAESAGEKSIPEQERLLKSYQAGAAASVAALQAIQKAGKDNSAEFHKAQLTAYSDLQIVYELQKSIEAQKDKRIVGFGGKDPKGKDAGNPDDAKKKAEELAKYLIDLDDKLAKAKRDYRAEELKEIADQSKVVIDDTTASLNKRLQAYDIYSAAQAAIIASNAESEIAQQKKILDRIAIIKKKDQGNLTDEEVKTRAQEELVTQTIVNLRQKREYALNKLALDNEKIRTQIVLSAQTEQISKLQAASDIAVEKKIIEKDRLIGVLNDLYTQGKVKEKDYAEARAKIEYDSAIEILRINIQLAKDILTARASAGFDTTKEEQKIADLEIQLSDAVTKHKLDNDAKQKKSSDEKNASEVKALEKIKTIGDQVFGVIGDAVAAHIDGQKNALQDQSNAIDANTQKQIDAVNASVASEQDKAAKIAIINARAQAQKEQIAIRQKELDREKAVADKAKAIFDIILGTAVAVAKASTIPEKFLAGAIGAAELAIAIATPIPKFRTGRKGGAATMGIVGDGGQAEVMHSPDFKEAYLTPATDTLAYIPKDWGIAPSVEEFQQRAFGMSNVQMKSMPVVGGNDRLVTAMAQEIRGLKVAIMGRPYHGTEIKDGELRNFIDQNGQWTEYINRNL